MEQPSDQDDPQQLAENVEPLAATAVSALSPHQGGGGGGGDNLSDVSEPTAAVDTDQNHVDTTAMVTTNTTTDTDDDASIHQTHGVYEGSADVPWLGCVCGITHGRPTPVFWLQCEGACGCWYNVASPCVGGLTHEQATNNDSIVTPPWKCRKCQVPLLLEGLPADVLFRVLTYCAEPTFRAAVVTQQLGATCRAAHHFCQGEASTELWQLLLQQDYYYYYYGQPQQQTTSSSSSSSSSSREQDTKHCEQQQQQPSTPTKKRKRPTAVTPSPNNHNTSKQPRRSSSRHRRCPDFFITSEISNHPYQPYQHASARRTLAYSTNNHNTMDHPRHAVQRYHIDLCARTEDAYAAIEAMADPQELRPERRANQSTTTMMTTARPHLLTRKRLERVLQSARGGPNHTTINVNRRSMASGRTLLHVCCAAEMNEGRTVQCVQYLLHECNADPNMYTSDEEPTHANRPPLYFAIARLYPRVVQVLLDAGANIHAPVTGRLHVTFWDDASLEGTFTPYEYARQMQQRLEEEEPSVAASRGFTPSWAAQLKACVRILKDATLSVSSSGATRPHRLPSIVAGHVGRNKTGEICPNPVTRV